MYTYVGVFFNTKKASNLTTPTTRPLHRGGDFPEQRVAVGASSGESLRKEGVFWVVCVFFPWQDEAVIIYIYLYR